MNLRIKSDGVATKEFVGRIFEYLILQEAFNKNKEDLSDENSSFLDMDKLFNLIIHYKNKLMNTARDKVRTMIESHHHWASEVQKRKKI